MENLERALSLMGIGMITVFLVLCLVVLAGNFLIWLINRYGTPDGGRVGASSGNSIVTGGRSDTNNLSPKEIAVITSAVLHATRGQGKVEKIERK